MTEGASSEFLGIGWAFPLRIEGARVAESAYEEKVRDSIWIILGTAKGERAMRPDFGCGIHELVFATNNSLTIASVADDVREALLLWEPRIELLDVSVTTSPADEATLLIAIDYRVRSTNNVFNVVYPFYLERAGA